MIAFLNLKFWPKSQPLAVMTVPANRRYLQRYGNPKGKQARIFTQHSGSTFQQEF
ncbi:MAG: hypothetical protein KME52_13650 [Desmonostoc geniculatum HA4340-LM1]|jgi:hypothetical protein|nr:hypothetical protein [Desmonostoc geniculatum HA4340-LM1]